jgi:hypothetical protein
MRFHLRTHGDAPPRTTAIFADVKDAQDPVPGLKRQLVRFAARVDGEVTISVTWTSRRIWIIPRRRPTDY